jgi:hypothetical protein
MPMLLRQDGGTELERRTETKDQREAPNAEKKRKKQRPKSI